LPEGTITVDTRTNPVTDTTVAAELLRLSLDAGNAVGWDWNVRTGSLVWFGDLQTMIGTPSATYVGRMEDFRARVHPDREAVSAAVGDATQRHAPYQGVFRVVTLDGRVRWASARGHSTTRPTDRRRACRPADWRRWGERYQRLDREPCARDLPRAVHIRPTGGPLEGVISA